VDLKDGAMGGPLPTWHHLAAAAQTGGPWLKPGVLEGFEALGKGGKGDQVQFGKCENV